MTVSGMSRYVRFFAGHVTIRFGHPRQWIVTAPHLVSGQTAMFKRLFSFFQRRKSEARCASRSSFARTPMSIDHFAALLKTGRINEFCELALDQESSPKE